MGDYYIGHVCPDCEVTVVEQCYRFRKFVDKFTGNKYSFSCSYGIRDEEFITVCGKFLLFGEVGVDFIGCLRVRGRRSQYLRLLINFVFRIAYFLIKAVQYRLHILEMLCKHIMHILRYGEILIEQSLNFQNLPAKIIYHHYLTTLLIKGVNRAGFYECPADIPPPLSCAPD